MINVHIKIDTGMHRLGFDLSDYESIKEIYDIKEMPPINSDWGHYTFYVCFR